MSSKNMLTSIVFYNNINLTALSKMNLELEFSYISVEIMLIYFMLAAIKNSITCLIQAYISYLTGSKGKCIGSY